jgi:hypothetical protein
VTNALSGISEADLDKENAALMAVFSGKSDAEIAKAAEKQNMPIRMKEIQELYKAGYKANFDKTTNSYIFVQEAKGESV